MYTLYFFFSSFYIRHRLAFVSRAGGFFFSRSSFLALALLERWRTYIGPTARRFAFEHAPNPAKFFLSIPSRWRGDCGFYLAMERVGTARSCSECICLLYEVMLSRRDEPWSKKNG